MAELLPSELPLIIKKELIKAEDRINKTRTPNVDQDVVGGMPTDKPESTSIGETILDILCSQQFLKEWAKRLDENKQNNLEFVGDKDGKVMKEGAYGVGGVMYPLNLDDIHSYKNSFFANTVGELPDGMVMGAKSGILTKRTSSISHLLYFTIRGNTYLSTKWDEDWSHLEFYTDHNTYPDTNGFLKDRKSDLYALTNNKLTSDLNVDRTDYIASAKSAHDINKKAISAQNTANTAVANAKTAQSRADSAYALADKKIDKASIANTLGNSTTLVASQKLVSDIAEVPVDQIFAFDTATPPKGYIARNGQAIDKNTMPKLYGRYGANMPDDRNRVHRMEGSLTGSAGTIQNDQIGSHNHAITAGWSDDGAIFRSADWNAHAAGKRYTESSGGNETRVKSRIVIFCNKIQ